MSRILYQVDAFTDRPFHGNPAGVCVLPAPAGAAWMQRVAAEMNLSETAFLVPRGAGDFDLRWFTPAVEVDLCGHATLASAHVLWERGYLAAEREAIFHTKSGTLRAVREDDGGITMDFPAEPVAPVPEPPGLAAALGVRPRATARNRMDLLVELADADAVRSLTPDVSALSRLDARGIIVTAPGDAHDFVSRFFAPRVGIAEDPVTGSAHCALGPYWAERLNRPDLVGFQASARGGVVRVRPEGDRVWIGGQAVTVMALMLLA